MSSVRYTVCLLPASERSEEALRAEANELRFHIATVEQDISVRRALARARDASRTPSHLEWEANAKAFLAKISKRYAEVRLEQKTRRDQCRMNSSPENPGK